MRVPPSMLRSEEGLRYPVRSFLQRRGYRVQDEVRFNGRIADLVASRDDRVVAVELKLEDWETALTQARAYQVGAPLAYVALPDPVAGEVVDRHEAAFVADGVGLLGVDPPDRVEVLVDADPSDRTLPFLAEALSQG